MRIILSPEEMQSTVIALKKGGKRIAFVPTMGNLHHGHLSLITQAKANADVVVGSIFVNPLQFGPNEDFDAYPRTFESDRDLLIATGADILFLPTTQDIYPQGLACHTTIAVPDFLTDKLCGASRPGHFLGVSTVVNILFNIVQPDVAIFGKKDFQQLMVIKKMTQDLRLPIEIIGSKIVREENGLAMSSRNGYLSDLEKDHASHLRATIVAIQKQVEGGDRHYRNLEKTAIEQLKHDKFTVDYFQIVRQTDLEPAQVDDQQILIAAAAWLGQPRLIDNQEVNL